MARVAPLTILCALIAAACGPVTRHVDRIGFGPGPYLPSSAGSPMADGEVRLAAEANSVAVLGPKTYSDCGPNAPGIWLPRLQLGGSVNLGLADWISMGIFARFARLDWAEPCNHCLDKFQDHDGSLLTYSAGLGTRFNFPLDDPAFLSLALEIGAMNFRQEISGNTEPESVMHFGGFLMGGSRLGSGFSVYGLVGIESLRSNRMSETWEDHPDVIGSDEPDDNFPYAAIPVGAGIEYRYEQLFLNAMAFYPFTSTTGISFGPSATFQAGVTL